MTELFPEVTTTGGPVGESTPLWGHSAALMAGDDREHAAHFAHAFPSPSPRQATWPRPSVWK